MHDGLMRQCMTVSVCLRGFLVVVCLLSVCLELSDRLILCVRVGVVCVPSVAGWRFVCACVRGGDAEGDHTTRQV